jgi:molybdenum cofactor cytidylyltransferase
MTGLIILAAGESNRLGFPKQTLLYKGKTLLELAIEAGLKSKCRPINVVLGANIDAIETGIKKFGVNIIHNIYWAEGMASSIRMAIDHLRGINEIDSAVIMLCDQPFVTRAIIDSLLYKQQETGKKIIACAYNDILGVPALLDRSLFNELLLLTGQEGAKKILNNHPDDIAAIPFEKGSIDIDTLADYEDLIKKS